MTSHLLAEAVTRTSTGEAVVFWFLAPVALAAALGMVLSKNTVHAALWLVLVMFCLAVFYVVQQAPFLGAVQVIVYAGAIMVLFLFVVMLVGVDYSESLTETLRGQRVTAILLALGFGALLLLPIARAVTNTTAKGLGEAGFNDNVGAIARVLFTKYVFAFEVVSALLIVAAVGAMVLGHRDLRGTRLSQREQSLRRFADPDRQASPLPGPGVYALHDAVDRPALLPDGSAAPTSVTTEYADGIDEAYQEVIAETGGPMPIEGSRTAAGSGAYGQSSSRPVGSGGDDT
ncbi:MAG TPA: NADH-quinone oxidoreductase subunit J [Frankiaceae bacterium]|nr:NADH-quinone oxidoreductase subunit J [Frankiaceae bacterium]